MSGGGPPLPPPIGRAGGNPLLKDPIQNLVKKSQSPRPILCGDARRVPLLRQAGPTGAAQPIDAITLDLLLTVLVTAADKAPAPANEPNSGSKNLATLLATKVQEFNEWKVDRQRRLINFIWRRLVIEKIPDTYGENMSEPAGVVTPQRTPLPTSLAPVDPAISAVTLRAATPNAWRDFSVGFRVDGKLDANGDDYANRVNVHGCLPLAHNRAALRAVRGWVVDDTTVEDHAVIFMWAGNRDVFNETGTCVSRSLFGSTAFPERDSNSAADGVTHHNLLALDCRGLRGVDTEAWQLSLGMTSNWRPGEKAFLGIKPNRILAWTKLLRRPGGPNGGWSFMFPATDWTWVSRPDAGRVTYLENELRAWRPNIWYVVPADYDFAS